MVRNSSPSGLEERREGLGALHRQAELLDVLRPHAGHEVEAVGVPRRDTRDRRRSQAPVGQESRAGEGVRPAAGVPHRHELGGTQVVEHRHGVRHHVGHRASWLRCRPAVAGSAVGHQTKPVVGGGSRRRRVGDGPTRRTGVEHHRQPVDGAADEDLELTAVRCRHHQRLRVSAHGRSVVACALPVLGVHDRIVVARTVRTERTTMDEHPNAKILRDMADRMKAGDMEGCSRRSGG